MLFLLLVAPIAVLTRYILRFDVSLTTHIQRVLGHHVSLLPLFAFHDRWIKKLNCWEGISGTRTIELFFLNIASEPIRAISWYLPVLNLQILVEGAVSILSSPWPGLHRTARISTPPRCWIRCTVSDSPMPPMPLYKNQRYRTCNASSKVINPLPEDKTNYRIHENEVTCAKSTATDSKDSATKGTRQQKIWDNIHALASQ